MALELIDYSKHIDAIKEKVSSSHSVITYQSVYGEASLYTREKALGQDFFNIVMMTLRPDCLDGKIKSKKAK